MILVDTSVLVNYFKGKDDDKTNVFDEITKQGVPFAISTLTVMEILQGARNKTEWEELEKYLSQQMIVPLPEEYYIKGANLYYDLRRKGKSIRSTMDILIALSAIENKYYLLHDDKDFDNMSSEVRNLLILE